MEAEKCLKQNFIPRVINADYRLVGWSEEHIF
jgi:hypothetical protein